MAAVNTNAANKPTDAPQNGFWLRRGVVHATYVCVLVASCGE